MFVGGCCPYVDWYEKCFTKLAINSRFEIRYTPYTLLINFVFPSFNMYNPLGNSKILILSALLLLFSISFATHQVVSSNGVLGTSCYPAGDNGYQSIQGAIDASGDGDTIIVCNDSTYTENVVVNKSVNLYGNESGVIVSAQTPNFPVFQIESDFVNMSNFTAQDGYAGGSGIYITGNNTQISEVYSQNNYYAVYLVSSSNDNLTNILVSGTQMGFRLDSSSNDNFTNIIASGGSYGFYITSSSNNLFTNITATSSSSAFLLASSSNNNLTDVNASNSVWGFDLTSSPNNTFIDDIAQENSQMDFIIRSPSVSDCNNLITNMTGSGNRLIEYANETVTWSNLDVSELILCNADGSTLDNVTVDGSGTLENNGFLIFETDNAVISNSNSSNNNYAIELFTSSNNSFTNNTDNSNTYGIYLISNSNYNIFTNSTSNGNSNFNFFLSSSSNNSFTGSNASNDPQSGFAQYGFYLTSSSNNNFTNSNTNNDTVDGFHLEYYSSNNNFSNSTATDNSRYGFYVNTYSSNNEFTHSISQENGLFDLFVEPDTDSCNNLITNMTGSGNRLIEYANETVTWSNLDVSELILCNADGSTLDNVTVDGSGTLENNGFLIFETDNAVISNSNSSGNYGGLYLVTSTNNNFTNSIANNNNVSDYPGYGVYLGYGIYLASSSNDNIFVNSTVNNNSNNGFYLTSSSYNNFTNSNANSNSQYGFQIQSNSNYNIFTNSTANNNYDGFVLQTSSNNNFTNSISNNNVESGFSLSSSSNNSFIDSIAQENSVFDFNIDADADSHCNNLVTNMTGSGGRPINYTNETVTWANLDVSELVLCNADGSTLDNVTVNGSDTFNNNGLFVFRTDNAIISNSISSDNYYGIDLSRSSNNNFTDNIINNNSNGGFSLFESSSNILTNNTAINAINNAFNFYLQSSSDNNILTNNTARDGYYGFLLSSSSNNNFTNNTVQGNSFGFVFSSSSDNNILTNNTVGDNVPYGFYFQSSSSLTFITNHFYNNSVDFADVGGNTNTNMSENIFDNPLGDFQNFTNLSFFKSTSDNGYTITWTTQPAPPPANLFSFANKFTAISAIPGTLFNSITWSWTDNESSGHNESSFQLWKYNVTGWTLLNDTPDTSANALSVSNFDSFSDFAILESDITVPTATIDFPAEGLTIGYNTSIFLNFTVADTGSGINDSSCNYSLDGATGVPITNCANTTVDTSEGQHNICLSVSDMVGNPVTSDLINFTVDLTPPFVSIDSPTNSTYTANTIDFNFTVSDAITSVDSCWYSLDGGSNTSSCGNTTLSSLSDGGHTVILYANDSVNNINTTNITFTVSLTSPIIPSSSSSTSDKPLLLSKTITCPDSILEITAESRGTSVRDVPVKLILIDPYQVASGLTNGQGKINFSIMPGTYQVYGGVISGYLKPDNLDFSFDGCVNVSNQTIQPPINNNMSVNQTNATTNITSSNTTQNTTQQNVTGPTKEDALSAILDANNAITAAFNTGKDTSSAKSKLDDANAALAAGNYDLAKQLAEEAKQLVLNAKPLGATPQTNPKNNTSVTPTVLPPANKGFDWFWLIGIVILVLIGGVTYYLLIKKKR